MQLDGSHSFFVADVVDDDLRLRARELDVHPTGPLCGSGRVPVSGEALALERAALAEYAGMIDGLAAAGVRHDRRALRMRVKDLSWQWQADENLELCFSLPAGSYATVVLRELVDYQV
jgi:tRNA pseudouridine13 synthase